MVPAAATRVPAGGPQSCAIAGQRRNLGGFEPDTTNNRMEMTAAIAGLEALKRPCRVRLYSDSQYLRDGITKWINGWKRRGWRTADKQPVKNIDLWQRLDAAVSSARCHLDLGTRSFRSSRKRTGRCSGARSYRRGELEATRPSMVRTGKDPYNALSIASALETSTWPGCASTFSDLTIPLSTSIA